MKFCDHRMVPSPFLFPCLLDFLKVYNVLGRLPQMSVKITVRGFWAVNEQDRKKGKPVNMVSGDGLPKDWIPVHAEQEYVIKMELSRDGFGSKVRKTQELRKLYFMSPTE